MQIDLENIKFYHPPSPNPAGATSTFPWKLYEPPPRPRFLQYPVSSIHTPPVAAKPPLTEGQKDVQQSQVPQKEHYNSHAVPPRNVFDVELEGPFAAGDSQFTGTKIDDDYGLRNECALNLGTGSIATEPGNPANDADNEETCYQCTTEQHSLENQSARETQPPKEADYPVDAAVVLANSGPVYSGGLPGNAPYVEGQSATASDHFGCDPHGLVLSSVSNEFDNGAALAYSPATCESRPLSLDRFDNGPRRGGPALAETDQPQETVTEDAVAKIATCYSETGDPADEEVTEQRVQANVTVGGLGDRDHMEEIGRSVEDSRPPTLSSSQPSPPVRPPKVTSKHARSLRYRHERSGCRTPSSSVAVVIPARRSQRLMTGRIESPKGYDRRGRGKKGDDLNTQDRIKDQSSVSRSGREEGRERPRKRRRSTSQLKGTACSKPKLTGQIARRRTGVSQQSPDLGPAARPNETKEVFGRGILRIQPHGPRDAYFITFLPDVAHCDPMQLAPETPCGLSQHSNVVSRSLSKSRQSAQRASSKRIRHSSVTETEDKGVRFSRRQIQQNGTARSGDSKRPCVASRKGMPWSREEEDLLKTLRKDRGLPWSEVARCFTKQFPGRSQGSMQVYWSTHN